MIKSNMMELTITSFSKESTSTSGVFFHQFQEAWWVQICWSPYSSFLDVLGLLQGYVYMTLYDIV
jgi:hypothetical protein